MCLGCDWQEEELVFGRRFVRWSYLKRTETETLTCVWKLILLLKCFKDKLKVRSWSDSNFKSPIESFVTSLWTRGWISQTLSFMMEQTSSFHGTASSLNWIHPITDPFKAHSSLSTAFISQSNHQRCSLHLTHHYQNLGGRFQTMSVRLCPLLSLKWKPLHRSHLTCTHVLLFFHCSSDRCDHFTDQKKKKKSHFVSSQRSSIVQHHHYLKTIPHLL